MGPHHASGEWREIADRVCTSISELAAFRGRPEFGDAVGVITFLRQPDPARYALPDQFDECMYEEILRLCSRTGGKDHFCRPHRGYDTDVRRFTFPRGQLPAEETHEAHRASHEGPHCRAHRQQGAGIPLRGDSPEVPLLGEGENVYSGDLPARQAMPKQGKKPARSRPSLPSWTLAWDPEHWATKEEATLSEMPYRFAPQEVRNLQMRQMV